MNVSRGFRRSPAPTAAFQILRSESKDRNVALQRKFRLSDIFRPLLTLVTDCEGPTSSSHVA
jgi:hypothetical protein